MIKTFFTKTVLFILTLALGAFGALSLPLITAAAAGPNDPTPPPAQTQTPDQRLEQIWARQQKHYARLGKVDQLIDRVQTLLDRATAKGKDASAVQAALTAFEAAWKNAKPTYESMNGIVNSHQGFDANGMVTDTAKAKETVKDMHDKFLEIKTTLNGTGKALRDAIQAFRQANPRPWTTATPTP